MSHAQLVALGGIAGATIFLGLPFGWLPARHARTKTFLSAMSTGVLVFLLVDILGHANEALEHARSWSVGALGVVYALGFGAGLLGLSYSGRLVAPRRQSQGPGAMSVAEALRPAVAATPRALSLGMSIAVGIGLHNFSEGLAIGQTANAGERSLAAVLVIGFALHNATEGFGIVAPLAAANVRPRLGWLALAGVVGGGPTLIGTVLGRVATSPLLYVGCLALAGGTILYVVGELLATGRRLNWSVTLWGVLAGLLVATATDVLVTAGGA